MRYKGFREDHSERITGCKKMTETTHEDRMSVYEIGYLITPSIPEEKVPAEVEGVKRIIAAAGASVLAEEAPHLLKLAYEIRRKTMAGSYDKFTEAYFGWIKFEAGSSAIETAKKAIEILPSVLRMLLITTTRENTYLGKHAPAIAAEIGGRKAVTAEKAPSKPFEAKAGAKTETGSDAPASVEEMDKSIDAMVKEA